LSLSQVATELGLSLPLSLGHAWIIALAGKQALPVSFSDLLGKSGRFDGNCSTTIGKFIRFGDAPFFGTQLQSCDISNGTMTQLIFETAPVAYSGNVLVRNNTLGVSVVCAYAINGNEWHGPYNPNLIRTNANDSFTVLPSN
jgi:hypothetical protein